MDEMLVVTRAVRRGVHAGAGQRGLPLRPAAGGPGQRRPRPRSGWSRRPASTWSSWTAPPTTSTPSRRSPGPASPSSPSSASRRRPRCATASSTRDPVGRGRRCRTEMLDQLVAEAKRLEAAGAALLNFTNSGPVVGAAVAEAVSDAGARRLRRRPVARRPDADGERRDRLRRVGDRRRRRTPTPTWPSIALDAITRYAEDVRAGRQLPGGIPVPRPRPVRPVPERTCRAHCRRRRDRDPLRGRPGPARRC